MRWSLVGPLSNFMCQPHPPSRLLPLLNVEIPLNGETIMTDEIWSSTFAPTFYCKI